MLGIKPKSPLNQDPSILRENTTGSGTPWSQYTNEEVKANVGSGKPLPTQYYQGRKVSPNINDAWQTKEQAAKTEEEENTDN